jgi:hypothetical protein
MVSGKLDRRSLDRVSYLKGHYKEMYPSLAAKLPDLPERIENFVKFKLSPKKVSSRKALDSFFEISGILDLVLRVFLGKYFKINTNGKWKSISGKMRNKVHRRYYNSYTNYYFRKAFRVSAPKVVKGLTSKAAGFYFNRKFVKNVKRSGFETHRKGLVKLKDPGIEIISFMPLVLFSIRKDGSLDLGLLSAFDSGASMLVHFEKKLTGNDFSAWEFRRDFFLLLHKLYFEQKFI